MSIGCHPPNCGLEQLGTSHFCRVLRRAMLLCMPSYQTPLSSFGSDSSDTTQRTSQPQEPRERTQHPCRCKTCLSEPPRNDTIAAIAAPATDGQFFEVLSSVFGAIDLYLIELARDFLLAFDGSLPERFQPLRILMFVHDARLQREIFTAPNTAWPEANVGMAMARALWAIGWRHRRPSQLLLGQVW
jgi:hypothetical protein